MTPAPQPHADQALLLQFLAGDGAPRPMDANPLARALGCELLRVDAKSGRVELRFSPQALFVQGTGVLQGGAVSAMLDFAMAFAVLAHLPAGASCATVNMASSFLRPAPQGAYRAVGEIERCGRSLAFTQARLMREEEGVVVATASSTLALSGL